MGLDDVCAKNRRDVLFAPEGSKDALAALHFAAAEGNLSCVGVVAALGTGVKPPAVDLQGFAGRRVRVFGDADPAGVATAERIGKWLARTAAEVQIFSLAGLKRDDSLNVKDLFDLTRVDYDDFELNRDLWSITDLKSKSGRVRFIKEDRDVISPSSSLPHESHEFPVYPVSNSIEITHQLAELALANACAEQNTARKRRWQLARDLVAIQNRIGRKLAPTELMQTFDAWYAAGSPFLDPEKSREYYMASFLSEIQKVRVPTGGAGDALRIALERVKTCSLPEIPAMPDAPESWRRLLALHRELARQSASDTYFLGCRDAAKAHVSLNKDSANNVTRSLVQLDCLSLVRLGDSRPGGKASEYRYLLPLR
jgi:hypothetical protein